jgi:DNA-binding transcriptional ArsR family regulator
MGAGGGKGRTREGAWRLDRAEPGAADVIMDAAPAYDLLASLRVVAGSLRPGRWRTWAEHALAAQDDDERRRVRRWFGGDVPIGAAYMALIPLLRGGRGPDELLAAIAALPVGDFVRVAITAGYTDPDTPLDTDGLLALGQSAAEARAFVDRHLRVSGRVRSQLLWMLTNPEAARGELLVLVRRHATGPYAAIDDEVRDERERTATRLRELLRARGDALPDWLRKLRDLRGFAPVIVAPCVFVGGFITYYHEIRRPLFDSAGAYEPYLVLAGTRRALAAASSGRPASAAATPVEPATRWAHVFDVLADPTRLRMIHLLAERPRFGQELAAQLNLSGATINHHITHLVRAGLVRTERQAHRTYFSLQAQTLAEALRESQRYLLDASRPPHGQEQRDQGKEPSR